MDHLTDHVPDQDSFGSHGPYAQDTRPLILVVSVPVRIERGFFVCP